MARLGGNNQFDVSDVEVVDSLDDVLDVAVEILYENAEDPGITRIERMARYLAANLGGEPYHGMQVGAIAQFTCEPVVVWRVGDRLAIALSEAMDDVFHVEHANARQIAIAILRAVELAEAE